ncbi:MAG: transcriptional regulator, LuxR family [Frankiales bacterium]|nr:transcriptional regulator, LuxR family [Frankiales bacterium]
MPTVVTKRQDDDVPIVARPLVGRSAELTQLLAALADAVEGQPAAVLVSGDAGVGKTRLLAEMVAAADRRQLITLIGHCLDFGDAALAYLPFTECFGRLARQHPDLIRSVQDEFPLIARLLPQSRLMGAPNPVEVTRVDRGELFGAVLGALALIGQAAPTMLLIEDAHWADQSTRDLVAFLLARLDGERVAMVVSYRSDDLHRRHPLRAAVAEWSRLPAVRRLHLNPLAEPDVRTLISSTAPDLAELQVRRIVERADGNAFFIEELVAAAEDSASPAGGAGHPGQGEPAVPPALADLLLVRLDRLSEDARAVVRLAAVAGRRVSHEVLDVVAGVAHTELDAALREAVEAHILEPSGANRYGFRHALLGEAVYDDLLPGERVRLHAAYATALAKESIAGTAAELARHARESHDLDTAFAASVRAGDEALAVAAPQEGMRHYEAALALIPRIADRAGVDAIGLLLAAADAASAAGHMTRALAFARDSRNLLTSATAAEVRARVLYSIGTHAALVEGELEAVASTTEALNLVPAEPPTELRTKLTTLHARALSQLGRAEEADTWARETIASAERLRRPELATDAWTTLAVHEEQARKPDEAAAKLAEIAADARERGQIGDELRTLFQLGLLRFSQGELAAAASAYGRCVERAKESGRSWAAYGLDARTHLALVHFARGDWDASLQLTDLAGEHPTRFAEAKLTAAAFPARAARGDTSALDQLPRLRERWRWDGLTAVWALTQAVELFTQLGETDRALAAHDELVELIVDVWRQPWFMARVRLSAVTIAALSASVTSLPAAGRKAAVNRAIRLHADGHKTLDPTASRSRSVGPEGRAWLCRLDAEYARLRWLADIDPPEIEEHLRLWRMTVEAFAGEPYERVRSLARLAAVLKACGRSAEAATAVAEASEWARRLQASPLLNELRSLGPVDEPAKRASGAGGPLASLTSRENDVLALLVEGGTNRQIARQLYISDKTVSVHVSNILAKLGVGSRTEAAAVARRAAATAGTPTAGTPTAGTPTAGTPTVGTPTVPST